MAREREWQQGRLEPTSVIHWQRRFFSEHFSEGACGFEFSLPGQPGSAYSVDLRSWLAMAYRYKN